MTPPNTPQSRAGELWRRFAGIFGADAVERKFGPKPPEEWVATTVRLRDFELERGMRRLVYSGKGHVPTLPEFVKLCRTVGGDEGVDDGPRVLALPSPDGFAGDEWDIAANMHLLAHVTRRTRENPHCYGRGASYEAMRDPQRMKDKILDASADLVRNVRLLRDYAKAWARDMREGNLDPATGELKAPGIEEQKAAWEDCMQRAEEAIALKVAA